MTARFEQVRRSDPRTELCKHSEQDGCYHCCDSCNYDVHKCGGCGEWMSHEACSGGRTGTCNECRLYYFSDLEPE